MDKWVPTDYPLSIGYGYGFHIIIPIGYEYGYKYEYVIQFQEDFHLFLKCRSVEMVPDGRMVLIIHGRESADLTSESSYVWEILAEAISYLVSQGLIDEEKLDSFNVPYYIASKEVEELVDKEGSFTTEFIDTIMVELEGKMVHTRK
ncbi:hypothetical protein DITRI_Ditri09bG0147000 [Diplodiscus trichospermus]